MFTAVFIRGVKKVVRQVRMRNDPVAYARSIGVRIGTGCRIYSANEAMWGSDPYLCTIGDCVHITDGVRFVTHDGGTLIFREEFPTLDISAPIVVGSRTYLGINTIILPGVTIGDRCVIGAGSVVSRNIPENSLAVGVPASHQDGGRVPRQTVEELSWLRPPFGLGKRGVPEKVLRGKPRRRRAAC